MFQILLVVVIIPSSLCTLTLKSPTKTARTWGMQEAEALLESYPETIPVFIGSRRYYRSYCYDGGAIDGNTGCEKRMSDLHPDKEELRDWLSKGMCKIGPTCTVDGPCWGSDASYCFGFTPDRWVHQSPMDTPNSFKLFMFHTCVLLWECMYMRVNLKIYIREKGRLGVPMVETIGGTRELFNLEGTWDGRTYIKIATVEPSKQTVNPSCFNNDEEVLCVYQGRSFSINGETLCGSSGPNLLCLKSYILTNSTSTWILSANKDGVEVSPFKSSSIGGVEREAINLRLLQAQMLYNVETNARSISEVKATQVAIVRSLSKIDENLLGGLLGTGKSYEWVNDDYFRPYGYMQTYSGVSNCNGSKIYHMGRWVERLEGDKCFSMGNDISVVDLYQPDALSSEVLGKFTMSQSNEALNGWNWAKQHLRNLSYKESEGPVKAVTFLEQINPMHYILEWFQGISGIVAWVSLFLHLLRR